MAFETQTTTAPLGAETIYHVVQSVDTLLRFARTRWLTRKTRILLSRLSDRELDDIGLSRSDIARVSRG